MKTNGAITITHRPDRPDIRIALDLHGGPRLPWAKEPARPARHDFLVLNPCFPAHRQPSSNPRTS
ncbi:MAG: hypothetical protein WC485_02445 [Opitutaceae bacterium]